MSNMWIIYFRGFHQYMYNWHRVSFQDYRFLLIKSHGWYSLQSFLPGLQTALVVAPRYKGNWCKHIQCGINGYLSISTKCFLLTRIETQVHNCHVQRQSRREHLTLLNMIVLSNLLILSYLTHNPFYLIVEGNIYLIVPCQLLTPEWFWWRYFSVCTSFKDRDGRMAIKTTCTDRFNSVFEYISGTISWSVKLSEVAISNINNKFNNLFQTYHVI